MEKTDAKIRLFLELSHQRPIQILNYIPLKKPEDWNPEKMYEHPKSQYYYAFINDNELISRMNDSLSQNVDQISNVVKIVDNIKRDLEDDKISIEFNGCNVDIYDDLEKNKQKIPQINENDRDNNMANQNNINNIDNAEEEKYVVFCKFYLKNFGFIHDFDKLSKEEVNKIYERPIVYALKGRIKTLLNLKRKDLELKKGDIDIGNILSNEEDRNRPGNEAQNKKDLNEDNNSPSNGIDGHWFLINSYENVEFLAFIKYKEKLSIIPDPDKVNNNNSVVSLNSSTMSNLNKASQNKYTNPHIFSYIIKDAKKFVTFYQNKSCKYHHNKNEFVCKDCGDFCCLECFEEKGKYNHHSGHKISLLDEVLTKFEEDTKFLEERIQYLKGIIETEIGEKKTDLTNIKGKNENTVNEINAENENIKTVIKKQQIERAKVLGFLGNEALRIISDYNLKLKYIKILNDKGDMSSYLTNYFFFVKFYKEEIRKNILVLERKILATEEKFSEYNEKLINLVEEIKKTL